MRSKEVSETDLNFWVNETTQSGTLLSSHKGLWKRRFTWNPDYNVTLYASLHGSVTPVSTDCVVQPS